MAERAAMFLAARPEVIERQLSREDLLALGAWVVDLTIAERKNLADSVYVKVQGLVRPDRLKAGDR